jgi:uncharacterized membrane protein
MMHSIPIDLTTAEIIATSLSILILGGYHIYLAMKIKKTPFKTSLGLTHHIRRQWAKGILTERLGILGVQSLRNQVMASSLLASTAILVALGAVSAAVSPDSFQNISHTLNLFGDHSKLLLSIKLLVLSADFFSSFFNFTLAIRYYNHAGFCVGIPEGADPVLTHGFVSEILDNGSLHYFLGMRGYYFSIPLTLWLFGPEWLMGGTLILISILIPVDRKA